MLRTTRYCVFIIFVGIPTAFSQNFEQRDDSVFEEILSFYSPFILPKIFQDTHRLREFIRTDEFVLLRARYGDLVAVDHIFSSALDITWNNYYEALLISVFATMNHRNVGIRLGPLGSLLWIPLSSEFQDEFHDRLANLPVRLYPDSPETAGGDRDKLQHFFGSALLAFAFESREAANRVGDMVELGEESFIVGGRFDERDQRANRHGRAFGLALLTDRSVLPSTFLNLVTASTILIESNETMRPCLQGAYQLENLQEER